MAVKKAKEASFKKMDSAFATSQSAIQKVKNTDPLNGNEEQEQGNENVSIDPAHYLSKKEKKEWKRLSYTAKQRYIRQAERQLKRQKKRNGIAKTEPSSVQEKEKQAAKIFSKERKYRSNTWKEPVDKKEIGSHGGNGEIASKSRDSRVAIRFPEYRCRRRKGCRYCFFFYFGRNSKSCRKCCNKNSGYSSRIYGCWSGCTGRKKNGRKFQRNAAAEKYSNRKPEDKDADEVVPDYRRK